MNRQEVSKCICAAMRLADAVPEVFDLLPERLASRGGEDPKHMRILSASTVSSGFLSHSWGI